MGIMLSSVRYVWFDKEQEGNKTPLVTTTDEDGVVEKGETEMPFFFGIDRVVYVQGRGEGK